MGDLKGNVSDFRPAPLIPVVGLPMPSVDGAEIKPQRLGIQLGAVTTSRSETEWRHMGLD